MAAAAAREDAAKAGQREVALDPAPLDGEPVPPH